MLDAIKSLLDNGIINESTQQAINEAWETKLTEAREELRAELREEFAGRYEHDKQVMVEALDKMVTDSLSEEIQEFQTDKRALAEDRAKFNVRMMESARKFNDFMVSKLAEEIQELRQDRKEYQNSLRKLEEFTTRALAEEIQEFEQDKRAVVETKVKLVREAKSRMAKMQKTFVENSAELVREAVTKSLESELNQLKEDIQIARENMFGRRIFEAFANEFSVTHLNENKEIARMRKVMQKQQSTLAEARKVVDQKVKLIENKEREIQLIKETAERKDTLNKLLKTLTAEKATVMSQLLESVQTTKLQAAFDKYLPAVLTNGTRKPVAEKAAVLTESRVEVTGDKSAKAVEVDTNVVELRRLAGLK
jgi:hypothetical protein